jgi:hypothetical protein
MEDQTEKTTVETSAPVEKTQEEIHQSIFKALGDPTEKGPETGVDSSGNSVEVTKVVAPIVPTFTPLPVWEELKSKLSSEDSPWDIPDYVKEGKFEEGKTELDAIIETIHANTDFSSVAPKADDPFIQDYLAAKATDNFDRDTWLKNQAGKTSIFDMKGKDFVKEYYKQFRGKTEENPEGYSDEDIDVYLNGKNRIELDKEEEVLRKHLKESRAQQETVNMEKIKQKELADFNAQEDANKTAINNFIKTNEFTKDFYGIELSEAERTQFFKELPGYFTRDPQTRMSKMDALMQSDGNILKLAALVWMGENGLKSKVSQMRENVKTEVEDKLGVSSRQEQGTVVVPGEFNRTKLFG